MNRGGYRTGWRTAQNGYLTAVIGTAAAGLLRWALEQVVGEFPPFITFYPIVILSAVIGGARAGLLATVLTALAADFFFIEPRGSLAISSIPEVVSLAVFLGINVLLSLIGGRLRMAHQAATSSSAQFQAVIGSMTDAVVVCDRRGKILNFNPAARCLHGFSEDAAIGGSVQELAEEFEVLDLTGRPVPAQEWPIFRALRGETFKECEVRVRRRDNAWEFVGSFSGSVVPSPSGSAPLALVSVRDITARKQAEVTLREQAELARLRADATQALQEPAVISDLLQRVAAMLVERLDAAFARIWTLDAAGQVLELKASAGLYTHLNGPHSRVPVGQLKIGRIAAERRAHVTNQVIGDPNIPAQDWARREGLVAFAGMPLLLEGRLLGVLALFARHPISPAAVETFSAVSGALAQALARSQAEEALALAREQLAEANVGLERKVQERTAELRETVAELEHFSYTITHDMRAPLRVMRGLAGLLLKDRPPPGEAPERQDYLRRIADAAERMDRLITDALQYSGVVRQSLEVEPVDPAALLRGLLNTYPQFQHPNSEIQISNDMPLVLGNKAAMTQCFSNLLGNAVKFVPPHKTPEVRVWAEIVEWAPEDDSRQRGELVSRTGHTDCASSLAPKSQAPHSPQLVRIWFEDNGIGIEREYQDKIWGMFQKLDKSYEGTGIGLALVRKTVERMGGRVGVMSEPGRGSRFWVELKGADKEPQPAASDQRAHSE